MHIEESAYAVTALAMVGVLAKRLNDLGQLDTDTLKHLRALVDVADEGLPEGSSDTVSILANLRLWLRDKS